MRVMVAAIAVAMLAGCSKAAPAKPAEAGATPPAAEAAKPKVSAAEKAVAVKIVEAGGVLDLNDQTLEQVAIQHTQQVQMSNPDMTPDQLMAIAGAIKKNLQDMRPQLKEKMVQSLTDTFSKSELDLYLKLITSKEGKAIEQHMNEVMQASYQAADQASTAAAAKAVKDLDAAWPLAKPKPPKPVETPKTPAKPAKTQ